MHRVWEVRALDEIEEHVARLVSTILPAFGKVRFDVFRLLSTVPGVRLANDAIEIACKAPYETLLSRLSQE